MSERERCEICGYTFKPGDIIHELDVASEAMTVCDMCYRDVLRRG